VEKPARANFTILAPVDDVATFFFFGILATAQAADRRQAFAVSELVSRTVFAAVHRPGRVSVLERRGRSAPTFTILRFYSPLPDFFDKSWQPSEIELAQ
jgi:hypothetical protein